MKFLKNVILLGVVLILGYFTAEYFGGWYNKFAPLYDRSLIGLSTNDLIFVVGFPFAYVFFLTLIFQIFAWGNRVKWTLILLIPPTLLWILADIQHIYLPVILGLIAFGIAKLINLVVAKTRCNERIA